MDLKLRQYEQGKAFCDGVVARGGIAALNRAWAGPEALPSFAELDDPAGLAGPHRAPRARPRRRVRDVTLELEPAFVLLQSGCGFSACSHGLHDVVITKSASLL